MRRMILSLVCVLLISSNLFAQELTSEEIFQKYKDVIATVYAYGFDGKKTEQATGVILKDHGLIVTNFRFFSGNERFEVITDKDTIKEPEIIGIDIERDLMLIKLPDNDYPIVPISNSDNIKTGEKIYAIGNHLGFNKTITEGILSGIRNKVNEIHAKFIQITTPISFGGQGGPVINTKGEIIGIVSSETVKGENLNFAIPVNEVFSVPQMSFKDKKKLEALNLFLQGLKSIKQGKNQEAIEFLTKYLVEFPNDFRGYNYRGLAYTYRKMFDNAIKDFNKAISLNNNFLPAYSNRGDAYYKSGDYEEAVEDYTILIKKDPKDMYAYIARGMAHFENADVWAAIEDCTKVIENDKNNFDAYYTRGKAYYRAKRYNSAMEDWKEALRIQPGMKGQLDYFIDNADGHRVWGY